MTSGLAYGLFQRLTNPSWCSLPSQCAVCRGWGSQRICADCRARFAAQPKRCSLCAIAIPHAAHDVHQCGVCVLHPPPLNACAAAVDYAYPWDGLISRMKFGTPQQADAALAKPLAQLMADQPRVMALLQNADMVVPMPLSHQRLAQRGFNQALELAKHVLARPTSSLHRPPLLATQLLLRMVDTPPQHHLPRAQRLQNMRNAFAVDPLHSALLRGRHVVIIDDVMTTGASLFAAAQALREAGAADVAGVVLARTPH
jgi:ComF family protein